MWRREKKRPGLRFGQFWPGGIASCVPLTWIGTIGMPCCAAMTAAPERTLPISPSRERVPSGNISRLQPLSISLSTWSVAPLESPPPLRPSGTVLNSSATPLAFQRFL